MADSALHQARSTARWYEVLLAVALVVLLGAAAVALSLWLNSPDAASTAGSADWRSGGRSSVFLAVMVVAVIITCVAFLFAVTTRIRARNPVASAVTETASTASEPSAAHTPAGTRLIGLGGLGLGILLLGWIHLSHSEELLLVSQIVYPATFAVALVLLFDKATRGWQVKSKAESIREWLLCDAITLLLLFGFLNLSTLAAGEEYRGFFWDMMHVAFFLSAFWLLDRTRMRYRFLLAYGYFVLLSVLLLLWRAAHGLTAPEDLSWWGTIWPFLILSAIFFVLEIIALLAARDSERHGLPAVKDALFVLGFAVLLIVAIPPSA